MVYYITKNYVEMMGGAIAAESEVGKGTEFAVKPEFKLQEDGKPDARSEYQGIPQLTATIRSLCP